jgi:hypothetical protein
MCNERPTKPCHRAYYIRGSTPFHLCVEIRSPKLVSSKDQTGARAPSAFYCSTEGVALYTLRHQSRCTAPPVPVHCATSARILGIRQNFHETPEFQAYANILGTRRNFHKTPSFQAYANNFMRSQNFGYPPVISYDANILCIGWYFGQAPIFYDFAGFCCCIYLCIFSVFIYAFEYAPIFLAQLF